MEFEREVDEPSVSVGLSFESLDLVVHSLQWSGRDRKSVLVQNAGSLTLQGVGIVSNTAIPKARTRRHQSFRNLAASQ